MVENVGTFNIPIPGIEVDQKTKAVAISNISGSGNKYIKCLGQALSNTCAMNNSKLSLKKGEKSSGFKMSAKAFSILVFSDHVTIRYDFDVSQISLIQSQKELVTEVLHKSFEKYAKTFTDLVNTKQLEGNSVFEGFGEDNVRDYHKAITDIDILSGGDCFTVQFDGYDPIEFNDCVPPPSLKKKFKSEKIKYESYKIDGFFRSKLELHLTSSNGKKRGRGNKVISVTLDQLNEIHKLNDIILEESVYNFIVEQYDFDKYRLDSYEVILDPDLAQQELVLEQ